MKLKNPLPVLCILFCAAALLVSACENPLMKEILKHKWNQPTGSGTPGDPWRIRDANALRKIGSAEWPLDAHYRMEADISLPAGGNNWQPLGDANEPFTGSFDGNGYVIYNLSVNFLDGGGALQGGQSMFGVAGSNTVIRNLMLVNVSIAGDGNPSTGSSAIGGITGANYGLIENCYVYGSVTGYMSVGGIAGINYGTIRNCISAAGVSAYSSGAGGIAGSNETGGRVEYCYATGDIASDTGSAGGIAGSNTSGNIEYCVALNQDIVGFTAYRVAAVTNLALANNYGRDDMLVNGVAATGSVNVNGTDVSAAQWNSAAWWSGTAGFSASVWILQNGSLPRLRVMPGIQPAIQ